MLRRLFLRTKLERFKQLTDIICFIKRASLGRKAWLSKRSLKVEGSRFKKLLTSVAVTGSIFSIVRNSIGRKAATDAHEL